MKRILQNKFVSGVLLMVVPIYAASQFVPYSIGGSSLSCANHNGTFKAIGSKLEVFARKHGGDFGEVSNFLHRSDYKIQGIFGPKYNILADNAPHDFVVQFNTNDMNLSCFVSGFIRNVPSASAKYIHVYVKMTGPVTANATVVGISNKYGDK